MKHLTFLLLVGACVLSGCKEKPATAVAEPQTIVLDLDAEPVDIHSTGLIKNMTLIHLRHDSIVIDEIAKAIRHRDRLYLMYPQSADAVAIFDTVGNFVGNISRRGRGPGEYLSLDDMFIDETASTLNLVCWSNTAIFSFDLDGRYLRQTQLPKRFDALCMTETGYVGSAGNLMEENRKKDNLWLMDKDMNLGNSFFEIDPAWSSHTIGSFHPFSSYDGTVSCMRMFDDGVYAVQGDDLVQAYEYDLGSYEWPSEVTEYEEFIELVREHPQRHVPYFQRWQETDDFILSQFLLSGQRRIGIYDKKSGEARVASLESNKNKYFHPFGQICGIDSGAICAVVPADDFNWSLSGINSADFLKKYPEQIARMKKDFPYAIDDFDNPFLAIYYF